MNHLYRALAGDAEWPDLDGHAAQQLRADGTDLLAASVLDAGAGRTWPDTDRRRLAGRRLDAVAREILETSLLDATLRALAAAGVPCLVLKGAAVSRTHYVASWSRIRNDIDLLVPPEQLCAAECALAKTGWHPTVEPAVPVISGQRHFVHDHPAAPPLDVHVRLLAPVLEQLPAFPELWATRRPVPGLGEKAWTLADADALWYGCVHIALHHTGNTNALWLFDLDRLARTLDQPGWATVIARATATRTRAACGEVLQSVADAFGTTLPGEIRGWRGLRGESSERFLSVRSELEIQLMNLGALNGWRARGAWIGAHLLPDAGYMRERYSVRSRLGLAVAYTHRAFAGAVKWFAFALAGKR